MAWWWAQIVNKKTNKTKTNKTKIKRWCSSGASLENCNVLKSQQKWSHFFLLAFFFVQSFFHRFFFGFISIFSFFLFSFSFRFCAVFTSFLFVHLPGGQFFMRFLLNKCNFSEPFKKREHFFFTPRQWGQRARTLIKKRKNPPPHHQ